MAVAAILGLVVSLAGLLAVAPPVEWARFRGPDGSGIAEDSKPPITFGPSDNRIADDKLYIRTAGHLWAFGS